MVFVIEMSLRVAEAVELNSLFTIFALLNC